MGPQSKLVALLCLTVGLAVLSPAAAQSTGRVKDAWPEYRFQDANKVRTRLAATGLVTLSDIFIWQPSANPRSPPFYPGTDQSVWLYPNYDGIIYHIPQRGIWHENRVGPGWPELVGVAYKEAIKVILKEVIGVTVVYGPVGFPRTEDLRNDRVFLEYDKAGLVATVPKIG